MSNSRSHSGIDLVSIVLVILFNQYYEKRIINLYCLCLASRIEARRLRRLNNNNNVDEEGNRDDDNNNNNEEGSRDDNNNNNNEEVNRDDNPESQQQQPVLYPTFDNILNF